MTKQVVLDTVENLISDFLYYDRKEDDELPIGVIEKLIAEGVITEIEIVAHFTTHLMKELKDD